MDKQVRARTFGEKMVRTDFNPSGKVGEIKQKFADLIDEVNNVRDGAITAVDSMSDSNKEIIRASAISITNLESACMYAVKALTA